ncbi:Uncharacterised protein [Yersinia enterocolitica]|nr:Uncharacterised protein [Yersinia enterocolitica]
MRRSKFSLKANQASRAVNTPSALSSSEAPDAGIPVRPIISSTGAMIPPAVIAPMNHHNSLRGSLTAAGRVINRYSAKPTPDPKYSKPASNHGLTVFSNCFASGVPAPNSTAAVNAANTPGCRSPSCHFIGLALRIMQGVEILAH